VSSVWELAERARGANAKAVTVSIAVTLGTMTAVVLAATASLRWSRPSPSSSLVSAVAPAAMETPDVVVPKTVRLISIYNPSTAPRETPAVDVGAAPSRVAGSTVSLSPPPATSSAAVSRGRRDKQSSTDICEQHKMHKRYTNSGRSWRCAR
jgi:hypothetical protein